MIPETNPLQAHFSLDSRPPFRLMPHWTRLPLYFPIARSYARARLANSGAVHMRTPVLSILNMKGGVGKTTVSAHVMRVLYHRMKKRVLLMDLDAQFNLTQSVMTQVKYDGLEEFETVKSCFEPLPSNDFFPS